MQPTDFDSVQSPVSRPDSLRMTLANSAMSWGPGHLMLESVPFSIRVGPVYANRLVDVFIKTVEGLRQANTLPDTLTVAEFGAGFGLLSHFFLDRLKAVAPDLYDQTLVTVTDASAESITAAKRSKLYEVHGTHIRFQQLDASDFEWTGAPLVFCYSTYLADALPAVHVEVSEEGLFEHLVQTNVPKDARILNTCEFPPTLFELSALPELNSQLRDSFFSIMGGQMVPHLFESYTRVPIKDGGLTSDQTDQLAQLVASFSSGGPVKFNYSPAFLSHISSVHRHLLDGGVYMLSDFGFSEELRDCQPEQLMTGYGAMAYYSVCFPLLRAYCKAHQIGCWGTCRELDSTQEFLISKTPETTENLGQQFVEPFAAIGFEAIVAILNDISQLEKNESYVAELYRLYESLSEEERQDYYVLKTISGHLYSHECYSESAEFAQKLVNIYGDYAVDGYVFLAWIKLADKAFDEAEAVLGKVLKLAPNHSVAWASMGLVKMQTDQYPRAVTAFKRAIHFTANPNIWQSVISLGLIYDRLKKPEMADTLFKSAVELADVCPSIMSDELKSYFESLVCDRASLSIH